MRKRIAIDMDQTICDTLERHISWYNNEFGKSLTKDDMHGTKISDIVPNEHKAKVRSYPDDPEFFKDLRPLENSIEVIEELNNQYDIIIATAAMEHPNSFKVKYDWLIEYLPFLSPMNFIFCGDKGYVAADYLIDDSSRHFKDFKGQGVLFTAPHNVLETASIRVNNWLEVRTLFIDK